MHSYRRILEVILDSVVRANLAEVMDKANYDDHCPVIITCQRGKPAVLMSLDDFNGYAETDHLLSSPKNAKRLAEAVRDLNSVAHRARKPVRLLK